MQAGEVQVSCVRKSSTIEISNPYENQQGAFEMQNRLIETRGGLVLRVKEIEMEALSNDAILLIVEIP